MLSVVIPTLDAAETLADSLAALVPGAVAGLVGEVIVVDGGSRDATLAIADAAGCGIVRAPAGRGGQLAAGAARARGDWLMFLHADTVLDPGWVAAVGRLVAAAGAGTGKPAAAFRFALDAPGARARALERLVALRCALLALPYGDQGLVMPAALYRALGGYGDMPIMEDVDLVRRIGRRRLALLPVRAVTGAARYRAGFARRMARNATCLSLYVLRVPPRLIVRLYG